MMNKLYGMDLQKLGMAVFKEIGKKKPKVRFKRI